jgi:hypothetical protein|tara:strand:+ start:9381 stop:10688 length:1308 start_codon:yes stop_codon:yes gene_type:complete
MADENPHQFSTQTTGVTFAQITDDTDFPHTGLIKSLSLMAKGNMAVKGSATDFDITQASSGNVIQVAAGRIFKDNKLTAQVSAANFTSSAFDTSTGGNSYYHLLVVDASNVLQVRKHGSSTANKVPEYTEGDTIIALIMFNSSTAALGSMQIQFLTTGKTENSLSVGRNDSGYTESLSIASNAGDVEIEAIEQDKDIIFQVNDGGSAGTEVMRIDGSTSQIRVGVCSASATDGPDAKLDIRGSNDNTVSVRASGTLSVENSAEATSPSSRAYAFLSVDNGDAMVGGNIRLDDSVSGGTHDGYASGTNLRGGAGIVFTNTSSSDDGVIKFVRQNDSNDDTWTVKESAQIDNAGNLIANNNLRIGGALDHEGSTVGFYNTTPATQQSVGNLTPTAVTPDAPANPTAADHTTTAAAITALETKLNALIDALQLIGIIT